MLAILALAVAATAADQKPKGAPLVRLPGQSAEIATFAIPKPAQPCQNWAVAAGLEAMLAVSNVRLPQKYWVLKGDIGEVCREEPANFESLARLVNGEYVLDDARKVRLELRYSEGAPAIPDDVIARLRLGRPSLFFWKKHAFVLLGVTYDEYIYPNGQRMFEIRELRLRDLMLPASADPTTFVKGRDDPAEIGGIVQVIVQPIEPMPWLRK